ncbi:hypothetical protein A9Q99_03095 [Gammaproteobacteria bacterium 45_16_T64]|nr:hypothetical protein A9Q99_03095 [Gammaproteobacteria bacterium 45_16_T64]
MINSIKIFGCILLCTALLACSDNSSTVNDKYIEGKHYRTLANPIIHPSDDIVITEFFWYGCSHCAKFEPVLEAWEAKLPAGITVEKSPAMWNAQMKLHASIYYLSQTLETSDKLHAQLFNTITSIKAKKDLEVQKETIASLFETHGLTKETFAQQLGSFKIKGQVSQAEKRMKQAKLKGTPLVVVNGQYAVNNQSIKTLEELLDIASFLIEKIQAEKQDATDQH